MKFELNDCHRNVSDLMDYISMDQEIAIFVSKIIDRK